MAKIANNLAKHSVTPRNFAATYFQTLEEVPRVFRPKKRNRKRRKFSKKLEKASFIKKWLKLVTLGSWKTIPWPIKICQ